MSTYEKLADVFCHDIAPAIYKIDIIRTCTFPPNEQYYGYLQLVSAKQLILF